jgi:hypothetical protein
LGLLEAYLFLHQGYSSKASSFLCANHPWYHWYLKEPEIQREMFKDYSGKYSNNNLPQLARHCSIQRSLGGTQLQFVIFFRIFQFLGCLVISWLSSNNL